MPAHPVSLYGVFSWSCYKWLWALLSTLSFTDRMLCDCNVPMNSHCVWILFPHTFVARCPAKLLKEKQLFLLVCQPFPLPWSQLRESTFKEKYEVEMSAMGFCVKNSANLKRHNKLPLRTSSSLSQFSHFISCSQALTCISPPLLNVTVCICTSSNHCLWYYKGSEQWHWNSTKDNIVLCWWSATKAIRKMIWWRLPMYAHLIIFISFSNCNKYKRHGC